jgi:HK97 family phage prohead protease
MSRRVTKLFNTKASSIDEDKRSVTFVISTNDEDRYGEIVDQKSWDFKSYKQNPLLLWGHDPEQPENVLGTASNLKVAQDGSQTTAELTFDSDINPKAGLVFEQIKRGTLRTVSVGFMNHSFEVENDVPVLKDNELLEISVVPIPANPGAIALGLKSGEINRKDAKWLMDSMRSEADLMEEQYKSSEKKEKSMTPEQATAIIEGMSKLTEKVDGLTVDNQALREELAAEKHAREDEKEAAQKAAEEEEAKRKAEEDGKDDPAKGGDDDQPGAGKSDDIDDDTELTPELQAQIDTELDTEDANQ